MAATRRLAGLFVVLASVGCVAGCRPSVPKLPALTYDPGRVVLDQHGFWYAERVGAFAGLWRYDNAAGVAQPVVRAQDAGAFCAAQDALYLYDRFDRQVLKVDAATRAIVWRAVLPRGHGTLALLPANGSIIAVGEDGYLTVLDAQGRRLAERTGQGRAWYPQVLADGRLAVVAPDRGALDILHDDLTFSETHPFSLIDPRLLVGSGYDERAQTFYIATLWGGILRYDVRTQQWMAPWRIAAGVGAIAVDGANGVLLVYNRARGYVDVRSLETGERLRIVSVDTRGNTLQLYPADRLAVVASHGPRAHSVPQPGALYRFGYPAAFRRRIMR